MSTEATTIEPDSVEPATVRELQNDWAWQFGKAGEETFPVQPNRMPSWHSICFELDWHTSFGMEHSFTMKRHGAGYGVYRIIGLSNEPFPRPATINRLGGEDTSGTLYIGEGWLPGRINQFRYWDKHGGAGRYRNCRILMERFPLSKLGVSILYNRKAMAGGDADSKLTQKAMAEMVEKDLLLTYLNTFGDTPPLNCSI